SGAGPNEGRNIVKKVLCAIASFAVVVSLAVLAGPVGAAPGSTVYQHCPFSGIGPLGYPGCGFQFFDGNGASTVYAPTGFHEVATPSGGDNEVISGTVANDTGQSVIYGPNTGPPVTPGQTCYSFATGNTLPNWQLTISASGNFTLTCHS